MQPAPLQHAGGLVGGDGKIVQAHYGMTLGNHVEWAVVVGGAAHVDSP
jgi:hypothetical protein